MTLFKDQVEAKGTGVIRTGNQIVTYTTIETDIKVNSKALESLTILNAWFLQWLQWIHHTGTSKSLFSRDTIFS